MSTSGTYTFTVTRDDIVREAMLNIGKLGATDSILPQDMLDCTRKLNLMVKQWMGRLDFSNGLKVWTRQHCDLFLSSTQYQYALGPTGDNWASGTTGITNQTYGQSSLIAASVSDTIFPVLADIGHFNTGDFIVVELDSGDIFSSAIFDIDPVAGSVQMFSPLPSQASLGNVVYNYTTKGQRPLEIQTCVLRDVNTCDTPIDFMTLQTYEALPTKTQPLYVSDPTAIYYEAQLGNGQLYIDCGGAQDVTKHLHIVSLRPTQDFNNPLDNPDYPVEWFDALCWGLAKRIAPMYNAVWTKEMEDNHDNCIAMAREGNAETTEMYFKCNEGFP
jgi:hypothetical protein